MYLKSLSSVGAYRLPTAALLSSPRAAASPRAPQSPSPQSSELADADYRLAGSSAATATDELEFSPAALAILLTAPPLAGSRSKPVGGEPNEASSFHRLDDLPQGPASSPPAAVSRKASSNDANSTTQELSPNDSDVADRSAESLSETTQTENVPQNENEVKEATQEPSTDATKDDQATEQLTPEEQEQVQELAARDREVRTHEQAHLAAAGPYARGGPTYTYQKGPDGKRYAIGGEVQIDTSPVAGDPEATIRKAQTVRAAALAPAEPSSQDKAVAAAATKMQQAAQVELAQQRMEQSTSPSAQETSESDDQPIRLSTSLDVWA